MTLWGPGVWGPGWGVGWGVGEQNSGVGGWGGVGALNARVTTSLSLCTHGVKFPMIPQTALGCRGFGSVGKGQCLMSTFWRPVPLAIFVTGAINGEGHL